jgi:protein-S-isoprenylcysteine O-methyltransferase Ste14
MPGVADAALASAPLRIIGGVLYLAVWPTLLFVLAGDPAWVEGWIFTAWLVTVYAVITTWLHLKDPALLAERRRRPPKAAGDRLPILLIFLGFLAWIVLMPLDAHRFGWTAPFPLPMQIAGGAMLLLSGFFLFRSFRDNTFLSGVVRIQSERKQHVVSTGVYGFVRHPMYLGMLLMFAGTPLLLGSRLGLAVAMFIGWVLVLRIGREEQLLLTQLEGYDDYRRTVRYRLLPYVW